MATASEVSLGCDSGEELALCNGTVVGCTAPVEDFRVLLPPLMLDDVPKPFSSGTVAVLLNLVVVGTAELDSLVPPFVSVNVTEPLTLVEVMSERDSELILGLPLGVTIDGLEVILDREELSATVIDETLLG